MVLFLLNPVLAGPALAAPGGAAAQCRVEASPLVFGTYQVFARSDTVAVGKLVYSCTASVPVRINLSYATNSPKLKDGSYQTAYEICLDPACGAIWGDGSEGTQPYFNPSPPINRPVAVYFYGRVPGLQDLAIGSYAASVSVTVNW